MKIADTSKWQLPGIQDHLNEQVIPIRLAVADGDFPLICSVWYLWDEPTASILCASHEKSYLVSLLQKSGKCGFEVAADNPPYKGVRGKASVSLEREGVEETLQRLISRYLDSANDGLADWLLSRTEQEYVLRIQPHWVTSWDFSSRMKG